MDMTSLERLIVLTLQLKPNQTADELRTATGAKAGHYFRRTLKLLEFAHKITVDGEGRYTVGGAQ